MLRLRFMITSKKIVCTACGCVKLCLHCDEFAKRLLHISLLSHPPFPMKNDNIFDFPVIYEIGGIHNLPDMRENYYE